MPSERRTKKRQNIRYRSHVSRKSVLRADGLHQPGSHREPRLGVDLGKGQWGKSSNSVSDGWPGRAIQ